MSSRAFLMLLGLSVPGFADLVLNSAVLDPTKFRVTEFANTGSAYSMQQLSDGSLAVLVGSSIMRFTDLNHDGLADGPGTILYQNPGSFLTGFVKVGNYFAVGELYSATITLLQPGATPASTMTSAGAIFFSYGPDWLHPTAGMAARPTPGSPGSFDLVFNVGSQNNDQLSAMPVAITGLINSSVNGDSLYKVTINETGASPVLSGLQQIATGIRNVAGMQFAPNGDFFFADNAIDGPPPLGDEPPQADELNRILASDFGNFLPNFGYPNCYTGYRTGAPVGSGCQSPLVAFQPIANGTPLGLESEGPAEIAFSPGTFPVEFHNGIFIGFSGKGTLAANEENAVVYYDLISGQYLHFVENSLPGVGAPIGLLSTSDALFISDLITGKIYQISAKEPFVTSAEAPEPSTFALMIAGALFLFRSAARKRG